MHAIERVANDNTWTVHALALGAFLLASIPALQSTAQTFDDAGTVETIIGAEVGTGKVDDDTTDAVLAALDGITGTIDRVIMMYKVDGFEIVYLGDEDPPLGSERLSRSIDEHVAEIGALRIAMAASSIMYLALDEKNVDIERIFAADVTDNEVTVYVVGDQ